MTRMIDAPSERVRLRRGHKRAAYDRLAVEQVLDAGMICHIGHVADGVPMVLPTAYWREDDKVYWHGSSASRLIKACRHQEVCFSVTLLDGLVMARSALHHSANYRSVVAIGRPSEIVGRQEKLTGLQRFIDLWFSGRWDMLRPITDQELKATSVMALDLSEASAKIRSGPPEDDEDDYSLPIWAGVIPVEFTASACERDPRLNAEIEVPGHILDFDPRRPVR